MRDPALDEDADQDIGVNPSSTPAIGEIIARRLSRREALKGVAASAAFGLFGGVLARAAGAQAFPSSLSFAEIAHGLDDQHHVASGYGVQVLIRWGDAVFKDAPAFDPLRQSAAAQARQFGYDNDFLAFLPLPRGSRNSERGVLCSNHERNTPALMWPAAAGNDPAKFTREQVDVEMASQGHTFVEIRKAGGRWQVVEDSPHNRRFTALAAEFRVGGPAAGHARIKTAADPAGTRITGTLNNCAGGTTPWGTVLSGEENFHSYFIGEAEKSPEAAAYKRYGIAGRGRYAWGRHHDRFNLDRERNEPNRFGWVIEMDPYEPASVPVKRTALGRCKHEGAATAVSHDGRVAVYTGDDERFEYVYKFVSRGRFDPDNRAANRDLLDEGTLYVARFEADGTMRWLPLVFADGPLTPANGFSSQADVVIEARRAGDLLGATPMDRPEDVEAHPATGRVYVVLTYNERRKPASDPNPRERANAANPRANNKFGQIIEIVPPLVDGRPDHAATQCRWEFFLLGGDPGNPAHGAKYQGPLSANGWLACPDNVAFDPQGRIWIATDGQDDAVGFADSLYGADTAGPGRGITRLFFNAPRGAEVCGPEFTPDGTTLFLAIQHPGEEKESTFERPSTRWPDFKEGMPPRPAVVAITKDGGGEIGG
ncbi:MAG: PhoX family protein [Pseudomonadota bacterium]